MEHLIPGSQPPPSTEATDPVSSGVILQAVDDLREKKRAAVEAVTPGLRQPGGSTEATNPFPSGEIERRLEQQQKEKDVSPAVSPRDDERACVPITQLATDGLLCRILVFKEQGTLQVPGAKSIQVRREIDFKYGKVEEGKYEGGKGNEQKETGNKNNDEEYGKNGPFAECLAVTQRPDDICCSIDSPVRLELYYDSQKDSVQAVSKHEAEILIEPISPENEDREPGETRILERFDYKPVGPGAWRFSSVDGLRSLQINIFPRRHSFALVKLKTLSAMAGAKRDAPLEDITQEAAEMEPVASNEIIRRLDSLAELGEGQMLHVMNNEAKEYSLFRMGLMGKTRSAQVFQAKHSDFPDKVVVVKAFMLKSDFIVELFGGDARLEALIMDNVDARDLGSRHWCDTKGNKHFLGTRAHAERVLADISQALLHLRQKGILHNDIKPSNILFSEQRGAVLIDFGLATVDGSLASTGGTPWYIPEEYLTRGRRAASADVWALGVVGAYLLGHVPLPDSEKQVKSWAIRDIARDRGRREPLLPPTPAQERMKKWLDIVEAARLELLRLCEKDPLFAAVAGMLSDEDERMTAKDLASFIKNLPPSMAE
ncbi:hypothetical protein RB594_006575 [Gaeumannomyces avenae]